MQRYDSYKDSGIQWLGEIPSHWEIVPLYSVASYNDESWDESTPQETIINYVEISDVTLENGIKNVSQVEFGSAPSRARRKTRIGDIIISTVRTYLRAVAPITADGITVSTGFAVLRPQKVNSKYLMYYTVSSGFIADVIGNSKGTSYPAINASELVHLKIAFPPLSEQQAIASYLDTATAKIDEAIAQQQKMIDLLNERKQIIINNAVTKGLNPNAPTKPSGIDWIGNIPDGWSICKVKNKCSIDSGSSFSKEELTDDGKYEVYGGGSMIGHCPKFNCNEQNIIVGRVGSCGKVNFPRTKFWATDNALVLTAHNISLSFFYYCLIAANLSDLNESNAQPLITATKVKNVFIPLPTEIEQVEIADAIEKKIGNIELLIKSKESQMGFLKERKQIIINNIVTGKVKIS